MPRVRLDEDQAAMVAQFESFLEKECPREAVRAAACGSDGWSRRRLEQMAVIGVLGVGVPEQLGGFGRGMVEVAALLEVAGRYCLPEPLMETIGVAVPLLASCAGRGSGAAAEVARDLLTRITNGEAVVTVGFGSGSKVRCPYLPGSDAVLVLSEESVKLVNPACCEVAGLGSIDETRPIFEASFEPSSSIALDVGYEEGFDACALASAAELVGLASAMLDMAVRHAKDRNQFGRPIGSFQAVKHALADVALGLELARPTVWHAAWQFDRGSGSGGLHVSAAKALAAEAALGAARTALQVHGAIGYTFEHDLHIWMKRAWTLAAWGGDAPEHRSRVLRCLMRQQAELRGERERWHGSW